MSQSVFQMKMGMLVKKCPGTTVIHNDVAVYEKNGDHDANILSLRTVATQEER